ncbi:MAG: ATP-binding protein [Desulfobacterales bacterium]|jgi:two-component system sensor histidine kinase BaeS|nr:ATP-binding protein [Desulfobacterales bacterium]
MKFKLSYKIFAAFTLTSLMVVALMVGIIRFYAARNFADYVNKSLLERYSDVAVALAAEYQTQKGWQALKNNPGRWEKILRSNLPQMVFDLRRPPPRPPDIENKGSGGSAQDILPPEPSRRIQRLARRLAVFDADKQYIVGGRTRVSHDGYTLQEITVSGKTAGWFGLHKREHLTNPLAVGFLKQQSQVLYFIGGAILVLAALAAFLLSKHFLAPIRRLTAGTRALASRHFDTRIEVESNDELGQLAEDFNAMAQTLEKYERMRQQWISDIAHELRTPLSILSGEIEALQDGVRAANRDTLGSLRSEARHLSKIVSDLHELSLADAGVLFIKKEPVDPVPVLNDTLRHFQPRFAENQMTVENRVENESPTTVIGDADRLQQLFYNILENTLRYADSPGTLKIWQDRTANRLTLFFQDSGPGVPAEALERLFDRLYRVDKSRSRTQGGSGLGLSICKSIVNALGGEIRAANAAPGGLRIEIELPISSKDKAHGE